MGRGAGTDNFHARDSPGVAQARHIPIELRRLELAFTLMWHPATRRADALVGASVSLVMDGDTNEGEARAIVRGLQIAGVKCDSVIAGDSGQALHGAALRKWLKQAA